MIRASIRRLLHRPSGPILAALTLALGLGVSTALFTVTRDVVLRPFPFPKQEQVVAIWASVPQKGVKHLELTMAQYELFRDRAQSIEGMSVVSAANFNVIAHVPEPVSVKSNFVSRSFYGMMGARAERGRLFADAEHVPNAPKVAVISHRLWVSQFGSDPRTIGRAVDLEGDKFTIVGVLAPDFDFPREADLVIPLEPFFAGSDEAQRHNSVLEGVARMRDGLTVEQVNSELDALARETEGLYPGEYDGVRNHAVPLVDEILGATRPAMTTLFVMALLVLGIATFNAASIFVARAVSRQRDFSIRAALGASRFNLLLEVLTETLIISGVAAASGFLLARGAVAALVRFGPASMPRIHAVQIGVDTYGFAAVAAIAVAVVCALFASARTGSSQGLREGIDRGHAALRSRRVLSGLAGVQLAVSVVLLVAAALMIRSFVALSSIDTGFQREHVVTAHIPLPSPAYADAEKRKRFFTELLERVRKAPSVEAAGGVLIRPLEIELGWDWTHTIEGQGVAEQQKNPMANLVSATPGYLEAMGIRLLRGRSVGEGDRADAEQVMVVGQAFALRHWGSIDVIGKRVKAGKVDSKNPWRTIVGVVSDVRYRGMTTEKHDVYHPFQQSSWTPQYVAIRTSGSAEPAVGALRQIVRSIDPTVPVSSVRTTAELVNAKLSQPRLNATVLTTFAVIALLLSVIGVYAVLSYAVRNRNTEMGVRLAIGASSSDLMKLILREAMRVCMFAIVAGAAASILLTRVFGGFLYAVSKNEPVTLAVAAAVVFAAAIAGSLVPAMRAATTDPVNALRTE